MLIFIIWLIGWFVSYAVLSRVATGGLITDPDDWDDTDRGICAALSLLSWFMVLICLIAWLCINVKRHEISTKFVIPFLKKLEPKKLRNE